MAANSPKVTSATNWRQVPPRRHPNPNEQAGLTEADERDSH